jgi:hypothetical protein
MDDEQPEYWRARAEAAEAAFYELALAWRVPAWLWFALGIFVGLALSEAWPG